jgi:glycosyltransferase involved in cell wall biosynthesis
MIFSVRMSRKIALAYVGSIIPDGAEFRNAAYSPAGQMFQANLLDGLNNCGLDQVEIFSFLPVPAFPSGNRFWIRGRKAELHARIPLRLVSFVNVLILKQLMIGIAVCIRLIQWAWRNRTKERVILIYNLTVPPGLFILLAAKATRTKAIAALCDVHVPGAMVPKNIFTIVDFWLHKRLTPYFDGFIVASDAIAEDFCFGRPTVRIEGGLSEQAIAYFQSHPRRAMPRGESDFKIAVAGRLDEVNGIPALLQALKLLPSNIHIYIAGAGPLAEKVKETAGKDCRLHFLGLVPFQQVLELYTSVDLLVNMRVTKAIDTRYFFPSKFMEYVGSGAPVLSTRTGHVETEYGQFVYLLESESAECLAATILKIAEVDVLTRERMAEAGQTYVLREKTWDRQAARAKDLILECLGAYDSTGPMASGESR